MPELDFKDKPLTILPTSKETKANEETDFFALLNKLDKIIGNIVSMVQEFKGARDNAGGQNQTLTNDSRASMTREQYFERGRANKQISAHEPEIIDERAEQVNKAKDIFKQQITAHVQACAAENPQMPILKVVQKANITAEQMLVILQLMG